MEHPIWKPHLITCPTTFHSDLWPLRTQMGSSRVSLIPPHPVQVLPQNAGALCTLPWWRPDSCPLRWAGPRVGIVPQGGFDRGSPGLFMVTPIRPDTLPQSLPPPHPTTSRNGGRWVFSTLVLCTFNLYTKFPQVVCLPIERLKKTLPAIGHT